jgi:hypothetical protein
MYIYVNIVVTYFIIISILSTVRLVQDVGQGVCEFSFLIFEISLRVVVHGVQNMSPHVAPGMFFYAPK